MGNRNKVAFKQRDGGVCEGGLVVRWGLPYLPSCSAVPPPLTQYKVQPFSSSLSPKLIQEMHGTHSPHLLPHIKSLLCCAGQSDKKKLQRSGSFSSSLDLYRTACLMARLDLTDFDMS